MSERKREAGINSKMRSLKWLMTAVSSVLILVGILGYYFWTRSSQPVFTYEFMSDTSELISTKMSVRKVEGLEYSIVPAGEIILSEPSPDWGIMVCFTEDHNNYLYFYESYSPGGIDPFVYESGELRHVEINGKDMVWGIFGDRVIGSCPFNGGRGIVFDLNESLWDDKRTLVFDLIESAQIEISGGD